MYAEAAYVYTAASSTFCVLASPFTYCEFAYALPNARISVGEEKTCHCENTWYPVINTARNKPRYFIFLLCTSLLIAHALTQEWCRFQKMAAPYLCRGLWHQKEVFVQDCVFGKRYTKFLFPAFVQTFET